jgi:hypothetical protein
MTGAGLVPAEPAGERPWARVTENRTTTKIETGRLEAVISKKNHNQRMIGVEKRTICRSRELGSTDQLARNRVGEPLTFARVWCWRGRWARDL